MMFFRGVVARILRISIRNPDLKRNQFERTTAELKNGSKRGLRLRSIFFSGVFNFKGCFERLFKRLASRENHV